MAPLLGADTGVADRTVGLPFRGASMWIVWYVAMMATLSAMGQALVPDAEQDSPSDIDM
jgi:hypothetical protein